jgi:hypothetical protein
MTIELEKADRFAFPTGILDLVVTADGQRAYAACMDGIYQLDLPPLPARTVEKTDKANPASDEKAPAKSSTDKPGTADKPTDTDAPPKPKPKRIGQHDSYVSGIGLIESTGKLLTTAYDGSFHIRDLTKLAVTHDTSASAQAAGDGLPPQFAQRIHGFWSWAMAVSPDQRVIASVTGQYLAGSEEYAPLASDEPTVKLLDASSGQTLHALNMLPSVQCVAFDATSQFVAAGNLMGDLAVWEVASGKQLAQWRSPAFTSWGIIKSHCYIGGVFAVAFSPDSQSVYAAGMGEMRDPMAGNGRQLWQRFDWHKSPVEKMQETVADQAGEGLMETLAWHPQGQHFVMGGRLRGGKWNLGVFATESGQLIGQAKTGMRITTARYSGNGEILYLAGMQGQPGPKDKHFPDFGYFERYHVIES